MATHPTTFAPAEWLEQFEAAGGAYALTEAGLSLCVIPGDRSDPQLSQARSLIVNLDLQDRSAIADELRRRLIGEA